nr:MULTISPECIES: TRAP transporter small permease [unclassified Halomonas]
MTTIVVAAFCLMLTVMAIQVISRYTLGLAVPWTDEVSRYLFLAEIFLGSVLALRYQEHIRVTIVTDLLPPKAARLVAALADLIGIAVLLMLMGGAWNMMERTAGVFASTFRMSFSYVYLMQFIAALLMVILLVDQCQRHLRGKAATPPAKPWSD